MYRLILTFCALFAPVAAHAASAVALSSAVFVERILPDSNGRSKTILQAPTIVAPGDKLVFILSYHNEGQTPANSFVVTNPMPSAVAYQGAADSNAEVSIDGGKDWGMLASLKVLEDGRWRSARPEDVTHVRWALKQSIPAGAQGKLSFRGIVR